MKIMQNIARIISAIFSPMLIPTYMVVLGIELTYLYTLPTKTVWTVIGWTFLFTSIVPMLGVLVMKKLGVVSELGLNRQSERMWPYVLTAVSYAGCALFLRHLHAPAWLYMSFIGGAIAGLVNMAINFRWKISGHGAGIGGLAVFPIFLAYHGLNAWPIDGWIYASLLAAGMAGTSRLILERHTLMQVIAGFTCGAVCVWLALMFTV